MSLGKKSNFRTFKLQKCVGGSSEHCCVPSCSASSRYNTSLSFHCFPKDVSLRAEWLVQIKREDFTITKHTKVCSRHFKPDEVKVTVKGKRVLKNNVVPSLFEWNNYSSQSRAERQTEEREEEEEEEVKDQAEARDVPMVTDHSYGTCSTVCVDRENYENMTHELQEFRLKMESAHLRSSFGLERFSASPEDIQHYTRFASYEQLMLFWSLIESATTKMVRITANTSTSPETPLTRPTNLKPIDELFLFLTYLSTGCSQIELGHRFGIHVSSVSRTLVTWANFLYCLLGSISVWMSPAAIRATLPKDFHGYEDTQVIHDCTELQCQTPSSLLQNEMFYNYKPHCTFRALVGISPHGALTFVSSLFEGSMSDRELYRQSGVTALLSPDRAVMMDKGFQVDDLVPGSVHRPALLSSGIRTPAEDLLKTQSTARLRVHVERAIRRVKENKLFNSIIPLSITGSIKQIFTVACLLSNYQHGPLVTKWHL